MTRCNRHIYYNEQGILECCISCEAGNCGTWKKIDAIGDLFDPNVKFRLSSEERRQKKLIDKFMGETTGSRRRR
ncbi:hypothetical protein GYA19_04010 [Candidatus Beckwithbacteria bacterium]|nr:hypothetical protein [Candidatus Beckwithbacteria bacterium]